VRALGGRRGWTNSHCSSLSSLNSISYLPLSRGESTAKRVLRLVRYVQGPGREQEVGKRTLTYEKQKW
jgi:hypothetical protein